MFTKSKLLGIVLGHSAHHGVADLFRGAYSGRETFMYRNGGTYAMPAWGEMKRVRNVQITDGPALSDVEFHGAQSTSQIPGYKQFNGSLEYVRKIGTDLVYDTIKTSQDDGTIEDWLQLNGPITVDGSAGWRAPIILGEFQETSNGGDPVVASIPIGKADAYDSGDVEVLKVPVTVTGGVPTAGSLAVMAARVIMADTLDKAERKQRIESVVADLVSKGFMTAQGLHLQNPPDDYIPPGLKGKKAG